MVEMSQFTTSAPPANVTEARDNESYQELLTGCALAIGGNLLISVSLNLQKYTHLQNAHTSQHYLREPLWWLGLLLMGLGEVGNFAAYGFAPASLVAPLGSTTVIANMFIAVAMLKERIRPEDIFGCTLAIVGAFLLVLFAPKQDRMLDADQIVNYLKEFAFIVYICIETVGLVALFVIKYYFKIVSIHVLLLITALLASVTVITAKAVSGMVQLTIGGHMQLQYAVFWIMLVVMVLTAVAQLKFLNQAMKLYDSTTVVPTNFVFFTISAILAGVMFYQEFWGMDAVSIFMFLFGCLLCFIGVYLITAGRTPVTTEEPAEKPERLYANVFPTWLFSSMTRAEVQPRTQPYDPNSLTTGNPTPVVRRIYRGSSSSDSSLLDDDDGAAATPGPSSGTVTSRSGGRDRYGAL